VYDRDQVMPAAEYVAAHTQPDELVALAGQDWNPSIFYYARRQGLMVRDQTGPDVYAQLRDSGYTRLFRCPGGVGSSTPCDVIDLSTQ